MYFNRPLLLENLNKWGQCFAELKNLSENDLLAELAKCKQELNDIMAWNETRGNS
jgi:ribosomal protein L29